MAKQKRDNAYYTQRLLTTDKTLYNEVVAGRMTVSAARKLAGLGGHRTRLHELKNAWLKATAKQRRDFLAWLSSMAPAAAPSVPVIPATTHTAAFSADGTPTPQTQRRILEIMSRRNMTSGEVCDELGISRLNQAVMTAAHNGTRIRNAATVRAVEAWLVTNAKI